MKAGNLLTTQEAADYIGLKVSYLHKLMMKRVIPFTNLMGSFASLIETTLTNG